jgi:CheY-like chemotaxis protein
MSFNVLIVEDQPLIALNLQDTVEELGHNTIGIASNMYQALLLSSGAGIALVDVNLPVLSEAALRALSASSRSRSSTWTS